MKRFLILCMVQCALCINAVAQRQTLIDEDWAYAYGAHPTAYSTDFDDSGWRRLDLPHDWSVENDAAAALGGEVVGPFARNAVGGMETGRTVGGEAWYRHTITLSAADLTQRVALYFEGAYNQSEMWVNGTKVYFNAYGYMPFKFDITPYCHEGDNLLAVRVRNIGQNTRWYAGSGIYRHVWLERTPTSYLDPWCTKITTKGSKVTVATDVQGQGLGTVHVDIIDANGTVVASGEPGTYTIPSVKKWHPDTPNLYTARLTLTVPAASSTVPAASSTVPAASVGGSTPAIDQIDIEFGVRDITVTAENGFRINGRSLLLRGGCVHHDLGLLGSAAWDDAEARKIALLKAQGYNAVRCSHNLQSDNFMRECDRQGLIVIDECFDQWQDYGGKKAEGYNLYFDEFSRRDVQRMVFRDRNHPSVCFWSIGNEIPERAEAKGVATAKRLRELILDVDDTRPITMAVTGWGNGPNNWERDVQAAFQHLDVCGYNYMYGKYKSDHQTAPKRIMMGTESYAKQISENWGLVESEPYVIGDFIWTAMDYVGEAGIGHVVGADVPNNFEMPWPWFNGFCGDIDLIGQKKPQSYYHDVVWRQQPITMAVEPDGRRPQISLWGWQDEYNSWTFPGYEGRNMGVNVYSRSPQVRLYLNGRLIDTKSVSGTFWAGFSVPYEPGTLRAVEWDGRKEGASFELITAGEPAGLRLTAERWGRLTYVTAELVDSEGRVVDSNGRCKGSNWEINDGMNVSFAVDGATLLAAGNASPSDQTSFRSASPRLWQGRALAIVDGDHFSITATAEGLPPQTLTVGGDETSIGTTVSTTGIDTIYTLSGVRVASMQRPGLYIVGGRKVMRM